eukprot:scaffold599_cov130-Isochrysis_galbana.AAC.7
MAERRADEPRRVLPPSARRGANRSARRKCRRVPSPRRAACDADRGVRGQLCQDTQADLQRLAPSMCVHNRMLPTCTRPKPAGR